MTRAPLLALLLCGCYPTYTIVQETAEIPATPWNLRELNSPYDDRNAAAPPELHVDAELLFSSARARQGADLDLVAGYLRVDFEQYSGEYRLDAAVLEGSHAAAAINAPGSDERGPRILPPTHPGHDRLYVFASDRAGSLDLYGLHGPILRAGTRWGWERPGELAPEAPTPIPGLSDPALDEAYLTPWGEDRVLFARDAGDGLDLYQARLLDPQDLLAGVGEAARVDALSSEAADSFPYVNGDELVFASDRPGGYGGYDLYRARWSAAGWSAPENLGPRINGPHDERRPVLVRAPEYESDLLIFSSDRPGGLGGFDLYAVGLPR